MTDLLTQIVLQPGARSAFMIKAENLTNSTLESRTLNPKPYTLHSQPSWDWCGYAPWPTGASYGPLKALEAVDKLCPAA